MVVTNHTAPARPRAPATVLSPYFTAAQAAQRRAKVGIQRNETS